MGIKTVIFDMGGVFVPSPLEFFADFVYRFRLPRGSIVQNLLRGDLWSRVQKGEIMFDYAFGEAFAKSYTKETSHQIDSKAFVDGFWNFYNLMAPYPIMIEAVRRLRAEGFQTALLTNNVLFDDHNSVHNNINYNVKTNLYKNNKKVNGKSALFVDPNLFEVVVESAQVKLMKPDEAIYKLTLDLLGAKDTSEVVMLDDIKENLKTASSLGMKTIQVKHPREAIVELQEMVGVKLLDDFKISNKDCGLKEVPDKLKLNEDNLLKYLEGDLKMDGKGEKPRVWLFEHGQSNPTYLVNHAGKNIVLRKKPPGVLLPSAHQVEREHRVMTALGETFQSFPYTLLQYHPFSFYSSSSVPVPKMISLCTDQSILGTTFYTMQHIEGLVIKNHMMPGLSIFTKRKIQLQLCQVLANIHKTDYKELGLQDLSPEGSYTSRNVDRFWKLYQLTLKGLDEKAAADNRVEKLDMLYGWLKKRLPCNEMKSLIHGDFRLDNSILDATTHDVVAVIDWELCSIGDPIVDLFNSCLAYILPNMQDFLPSIDWSNPASDGLLGMHEYVMTYLKLMNINEDTIDWQFYAVNCLYRVVCILHGVYIRHLKGQSRSTNAHLALDAALLLADKAWSIAIDSSFTIRKLSSSTSPSLSAKPYEKIITPMPISIQNFDQPVIELYNKLCGFIEKEILPIEQQLSSWSYDPTNAWTICPIIEELKNKAKSQCLWNLFVTKDLDPEKVEGKGLTNLQYAFFAEKMGWSLFVPEVFNCSAPDTGNMEVFMKYANKQQRQRWLAPLLRGDIRSCFAMTEPQVASSDATNIEALITRDGDDYLINGRKWWTSGAMDPRCKVCILMGKTDPSAPSHQQHSFIIVPMETEGVKVVRPLNVFGYNDSPHGHAEMNFSNVRVPISNLILGEGKGFQMGQGRLGPGRVHHCMRCLGAAERSLQLMLERADSRTAFGQTLLEQTTVQKDIAEARIKIEQARLLVFKAAHTMDIFGNKEAALEIAMIKAEVPKITCEVIDKAIQVHGGMGLSGDTPLAHLYTMARVLRIADGPDEVHLRSIAKMQIKKFKGK